MARRKPMTLGERWAREEELERLGICPLFGPVTLPKAKPAPHKSESAISPKTDALLSKLKGKR